MGEAKLRGTKEQRVANTKPKYLCGTCFQKLPVNAEGTTVCGMRRSKDLKWIPICESCLNPQPLPELQYPKPSFVFSSKSTEPYSEHNYSDGYLPWILGAGFAIVLALSGYWIFS